MNTSRLIRASASVALFVVMIAPLGAQTAPPLAARLDGAAGAAPVDRLELLVGRSAIVRTDRAISRVSLPSPDIADALVTSSNEVLVHGKAPGTVSLLIWGEAGGIRTYDVAVRRDLSVLEERVRQLFPGEPITVSSNGTDVVLSGEVSSKYVVDKATSLAAGFVEKADKVVNLLRQRDGVATNQVLLRVRFAEVSRSAMQELGASFFTGALGRGDWVGRATTQQFPAPDFSEREGLVFSDFLNIFAFNTAEQLGAVIKALQTKGIFQSLAEPNLITRDGQEASFLAGGEYPYPVLQGGGAAGAVTIMFKEFGVRLRFTPTLVGQDLIQLKVAPEVSSLDFGNTVTIEGFRVPALSTRRTETSVELRDGQTFAIAGLLDNSVTQTMSKVPGIGDIPILGHLFRSRAYQKHATELVVMITPHIVRAGSTGVTPTLPQIVEPFLPPPARVLPTPPPAFTQPPGQSRQAEPAAPAPAAPAEPAAAGEVANLQVSPLETARRLRIAQRQDEDSRRIVRRLTPQEIQKEMESHQKSVEQERKAAEEEEKERLKRQAEVDEMLAQSISKGPARRWTRF